jgi:hypothetical protein
MKPVSDVASRPVIGAKPVAQELQHLGELGRVTSVKVVAGAGESFLEPPVVLADLAKLSLQVVVLGEDPLNAIVWQVVLQVADAPEQLADLSALCCDLIVCALEFVLGVECPLPLPPRPPLTTVVIAWRRFSRMT